jgi:hypothetical protein
LLYEKSEAGILCEVCEKKGENLSQNLKKMFRKEKEKNTKKSVVLFGNKKRSD